jgi:hypothetical protein
MLGKGETMKIHIGTLTIGSQAFPFYAWPGVGIVCPTMTDMRKTEGTSRFAAQVITRFVANYRAKWETPFEVDATDTDSVAEGLNKAYKLVLVGQFPEGALR